MIVTKENIQSLIPQRPPFVMIDELIYSDEKSSRTSLLINADNLFVVDGELREPGLLENIAQTAAARAGFDALHENKPVKVGYIGAVKNFEVFKLPVLNDRIETEITVEDQVFGATLITGTTKCNDELIARCEMKIFISQFK